MRHVVYESEHQKVIWMPGAGDTTFITFGELSTRPSGLSFWGDKLFQERNLPSLGFVAKASNWYPLEDMSKAITAARCYLSGNRTLAYGFSMGAYAVLKYSKLLGCDVVAAFSPQYSICPHDVGSFDQRFAKFYDPGVHSDMRIVGTDIGRNIVLFADLNDRVDALHAEYIQQLGNVDVVTMPSFRHDTVRLLSETGISHDIFSSILNHAPGVQRVQALRQSVRAARRKSTSYWLNTARRVRLHRPDMVDCWKRLYERTHDMRPQNPSALLEVCESLLALRAGYGTAPFIKDLMKFGERSEHKDRVNGLVSRLLEQALKSGTPDQIAAAGRISSSLPGIRLLVCTGELDQARSAISEMLADDSTTPASLRAVMSVARTLGLREQYVLAIYRVIEHEGLTDNNRLDLAEALLTCDAKTRARAVLLPFEDTLLSGNDLIRLWNALRSVGLKKEAARYAPLIVEESPREAFRRLHLVNSLLDLERTEDAAGEMQVALVDAMLTPPPRKSVDVLFLAWSIAMRGKLQNEARKAAMLYLANFPSSPSALQIDSWLNSHVAKT